MTEDCRKLSRYARKDFHLMTESSAQAIDSIMGRHKVKFVRH
jgi:hypothetical protein